MSDLWKGNSRAADIAEILTNERGDAALSIALDRQHLATSAGRIARADLYQAVSTILADRDQVFTRWKLGQL